MTALRVWPSDSERAVRSPDQPADAERDGGGRIRIAFHEVTERVVHGIRHAPDRVDRVAGGVHGLAIEVLQAPFRLPHLPLRPGLGVAGHAANSFFYFSAEILGSAAYAIFVHGDHSD